MELNPNNAHLKSMREHWYKIVAILLNKFAPGREVIITEKDVLAFSKLDPTGLPCVVSYEARDGIHLQVVTEKEGRKLAARYGHSEN